MAPRSWPRKTLNNREESNKNNVVELSICLVYIFNNGLFYVPCLQSLDFTCYENHSHSFALIISFKSVYEKLS